MALSTETDLEQGTLDIQGHNVDVLLAPICGNGVVMNAEVAVELGIMMKVKLIIPMHYESDKHPKGTAAFEEYVKDKEINYKILENGESIEY